MVTSPGRRVRPSVALVVAVALSTLTVGCQGTTHRTTSASRRASTQSRLGPVKVRYEASQVVDGARSRVDWEVVTDGKDRIRSTILGGVNADGPGIGTTEIWDGRTLLRYEPDGNPRYSRTQHPARGETPPEPFVVDPATASFRRACPQARRVRGPLTVLGRSAVRYRCGRSRGRSAEPARVLVLDEATDLLLRGDGLVVTALTFDPPLAKGTFSTALPARASTGNYSPPPAFRIPRVGGGELALADYRGAPLVIVTGDASGIRALAARLAVVGAGADRPRVIGLLFSLPPNDWTGTLLHPDDVESLARSVSREVGRFDVPVGIDFKGAAGMAISGPAGVPEAHARPAAVGFLRADGHLTDVLTEDATDDALRAGLDSIS